MMGSAIIFEKLIILVAILGLSPAVLADEEKSNCVSKILTVAIVDGYSSGRFLPQTIREFAKKQNQEARVIHIHSDGKPIDFMAGTFIKENFDADYAYDGKFEDVVAWLRKNNPQAIMVGSEGGVLLADQLSYRLHEELGVPTNGVLLARRDKYEMAEVLRSKGVPAVLQMKSKNYNDVLAWVKKNNLWPGIVVLKPTMSAGTDGVSFCRNEAELKAGFDKIMKSKNEFGKKNEVVLAQEFLGMDNKDLNEYVVNSVSSEGHHVITDIWKYTKKEVEGAGAIYEFDRLIAPDGEVQKQLIEYQLKVLEALGIKTGWGHAEIKMTKRGPILVEIGSRMMGSGQPRLVTEAVGQSQIELGVEAFLDPASFKRREQKYKMKFHAANVSVNSNREGAELSYKIVPQLIQLPSYKRHGFIFDSGTKVKKTVDMISMILQVELLHEDSKVLEQDILTLKQWEQEGKFFK